MSGGPKAPVTQKDNLFSQDLVEMVISFGEGVVWGLADGLKGFYVGNEPVLDDSTGTPTYNFPDFSVSMRQGYEDDLPVEFIMGGEASTLDGSGGQTLPATVVRTFYTPIGMRGKVRAVDIRLAVQSLVTGDKSGNTSQRACVFRIDYKKSLASDWIKVGNKTVSDLLVSGTRIDLLKIEALKLGFLPEGPDGFNSWSPAVWDFFEESYTYIRQNQMQGKNLAVWSREWEPTGDPNDGRQTEQVMIPKATWVAGTIAEGGVDNYRGQYAADPLSFNVIYGKTTSGYIWELRVPLPIIEGDDDDWQIRVTRISADIPLDDAYNSATITLESIAAIGEEKVSYPRTCVAHITAQHSNRFSEIPDFSCDLMGILCDVPTNYNPFAGTYDGVWLGGYKKSWTDNPVWILRELIMNIDWGDRSREPNIEVSDASFYEASQYCDELIPKFKENGTDPDEFVRRHTFNTVVQEYRSSEDLKRYVAGSFRSVLNEINGKYYLNTDKVRTPNFFVTPEMVTSELFNYSATDLSSRFNFMRVSFQNAENNYEEDNRVITNQAAIDRYGVISNDMQAVGATNLDEALRQAAFNMFTNLKETIMVSFKIPRLGLYLNQYDNFYVADRTCGWGDSGRVHTLEGRVIKVLTPITTNLGDCALIFHDITGLDILLCTQLDAYTFEVSPEQIIPDIGKDSPFMLSSGIAGSPKLFRLMSVKDEGQGRGYLYTVEASEVYLPKYELVDNLNSETSGLTFSIDRLVFNNKGFPPKPIAVQVLRLDFVRVGADSVFEVNITMPSVSPNYKYQVVMYDDDYPTERFTFILDNTSGLITIDGSKPMSGALSFEVVVIDQYQRSGETFYLLNTEIEFKVGYEQIEFSYLVTDYHAQTITIAWQPLATTGVYSEGALRHRSPLGVAETVYPISGDRLVNTDPVTDARQEAVPYGSKGLHSAVLTYLNTTDPELVVQERSMQLNWLEQMEALDFEAPALVDVLNPRIYRINWAAVPAFAKQYKFMSFVEVIDTADPEVFYRTTNPEDPYQLDYVDIELLPEDSGKTLQFAVTFDWKTPTDPLEDLSRSWLSNRTASFVVPTIT